MPRSDATGITPWGPLIIEIAPDPCVSIAPGSARRFPLNIKAMRITFLGAVGTVTGSKYLVETGGRRLLVDCGLFQGYKQLRLRNWDPPPVDPASIDTVILTHAH